MTEDDYGYVEHDESIVYCDDNCGALTDPQTIDELRAAAEHWRKHQYLSGCSHAR